MTASVNVRVTHRDGLHARPAALIARAAEAAGSDVWIVSGNQTADAKSIISILMLGCAKDSMVTVKVDNPKDMDTLNSVAALICA